MCKQLGLLSSSHFPQLLDSRLTVSISDLIDQKSLLLDWQFHGPVPSALGMEIIWCF